MSRLPQYIRQGWRPAGPGGCRCPHCGASVTTNALGRESHRRACPGLVEHRQRLADRAAARKANPPNVQQAIRDLIKDDKP